VGVDQLRQMLAYDMAAGRPEDIADKEDIHSWKGSRFRCEL
jgi:hypothetical protein